MRIKTSGEHPFGLKHQTQYCLPLDMTAVSSTLFLNGLQVSISAAFLLVT